LHIIDLALAKKYMTEHSLNIRTHDGFAHIEFSCDEEEPENWRGDELEWLNRLILIRSELMEGDYRSLYLAWLRDVESEEVATTKVEPPIPPGLQDLSATQRYFVDFLNLSEDILAVAAIKSAPLTPQGVDL
jgi:hypothetical protein